MSNQSGTSGGTFFAIPGAAGEELPEEGRRKIPSDVLGSYTGMGEDFTAPVQDADDL